MDEFYHEGPTDPGNRDAVEVYLAMFAKLYEYGIPTNPQMFYIGSDDRVLGYAVLRPFPDTRGLDPDTAFLSAIWWTLFPYTHSPHKVMKATFLGMGDVITEAEAAMISVTIDQFGTTSARAFPYRITDEGIEWQHHLPWFNKPLDQAGDPFTLMQKAWDVRQKLEKEIPFELAMLSMADSEIEVMVLNQ